LLQAPQPAHPKSLARALINDCTAAPVPFLLVFDDYHVITESAIHEAVAYLLDRLPPHLHLLITSRTDPLLPLPRLRARGQLTELRTADLRFTAQETADFLQQAMGLNLSSAQVSALEARTEGWIAGLQMAALSIQGLERADDVSAFVTDFAGSHRYIFDYLTDEVLQQRPPNTRTFLLETSILDRFNASLCAAVTGQKESQAIIESLEKANLFLFPLDEHRQWYRYHQLFAAFLQHRLLRRPEQERDTLHLRAANWFETNESPDQAIKHYGEANAYENIAELIKQYGAQTIQPGQLNRLQRWLHALPAEHVQSDPLLAMLQAWIHYFEQQTGQVAIWVERALNRLENAGGASLGGDKQLRGSLVGLRSWLAAQHGDFKRAVRLAETALVNLAETESVWRGIVTIFWGQALFGEGRTAEAIAAYERVLQHNDETANWITTSAISNAIGMTLTLRGRLNEAHFQLDKFIAILTALGQEPTASGLRLQRLAIMYERNELETAGEELLQLRSFAQYGFGLETGRYHFLSALYYAAVGDAEATLSRLSQAEEDVASWAEPHERALALASIMRVYVRLGHLQEPFAWLQSATVDRNNLTLLRVSEYLAMADITRFHASRQAQQEALALLEAVHILCDEAQTYGIKIDVFCLQALLMASIDDEQGALAALGNALILAEPEGYVRTIVDFGPPMVRLLRAAEQRKIHADYARFLLTQFSHLSEEQTKVVHRHVNVEPLSARELDVLTYLATHLTGPEIADHLTISLNTLKTHTRNIYGKLGVHSRHDAVVRGQELGLLA
jgi:LuxR family maltose regulon positive regulatory protein